MPSRPDLDPIEIPSEVLPSLYLVDVESTSESRRNYRFRLIGTAIAARSGRDATGMDFAKAYPNLADYSAHKMVYDDVVTSAEPMHDEYPMRVEGRDFIRVSRLLLPLSSDGIVVDMIIGSSAYLD